MARGLHKQAAAELGMSEKTVKVSSRTLHAQDADAISG
jgi:hypothetical protein